ncbi:hypothetical protein BJA01nite_38300 [Bradyrhizobium japonicum]|nr:hypothetical protein BJ6T_33350 [Bradyrhizobium japonicum USDA 6]GEC46188.1 hypothetical protein BJA01nite_38300 [Bradyrhizobium japonicum]
MCAFVAKRGGEFRAPFRRQCIHEFAGDEHRSLQYPAMGFNPTSDIHGITDQGEFQFLFIADVSIDDFAVMDTDGDTERLVSRLNASVPGIDGFDKLDRTLRSVRGVAQVGQFGPKKAISPSPMNLSIEP